MIKTILLLQIFELLFLVSCGSSTTTRTGGASGVPPSGEWAIYALKAPEYEPAASIAMWGTDTLDPDFIAAWTKETIYDATGKSFFSGIAQSDWSNGITTLKGSFKAALPSITAYTCYDRNKTDDFGNAINSNCYVDSKNPNSITCNINYSFRAPGNNAILQNSQSCVITTPGSPSTPATLGNTCTATDVNLSTVGCYPDGQGPDSSTKHLKGFYCTQWQQTTYDLTQISQVLKNIRNSNSAYGCMAPVSVLTADTKWGGLGIGSSCTAEDPGIIDVGTWISKPTYLDPVLMYVNPFTDAQISNLESVSLGSAASDGFQSNGIYDSTNTGAGQYSIWKNILQFCSDNKGFCQLPSGALRPGIAHVFGRAGPVALTEYVNLIKANAPNDYSWQYDDGPALIQCDAPNTKLIVSVCKNGTATFPTAPAAYGSSRLAILNNCDVDIWVQQKTVTKVLPNITPKAVNNVTTTGTESCVPSSGTDLSCDFLVHLPPGQAHAYNTPVTGIQSLNMSIKSGCQSDGYHCVTGETVDNPNRPGYDSKCPDTALKSGSTCQTNYGPQPDIETKIEGTFGCTATDTTTCTKTQNGSILAPSTFVDTSFVDGFTWVVGVQVIKDTTEVKESCRNHDVPQLTVDQCPTAANLSTRPN